MCEEYSTNDRKSSWKTFSLIYLQSNFGVHTSLNIRCFPVDRSESQIMQKIAYKIFSQLFRFIWVALRICLMCAIFATLLARN